MSVAEKLKALDAAIKDEEWTPTGTRIPVVIDALPQIVAVVEAAEKAQPQLGFAKGHPLYDALTALDEALS